MVYIFIIHKVPSLESKISDTNSTEFQEIGISYHDDDCSILTKKEELLMSIGFESLG